MKQLMSKNGYAVTKIACELLNVSLDSRIPRISDFSENMNIGRGTVQNALRFIEENKGIALESRGHLGTFVKYIDRKKLWNLAGYQTVLGTMPLPYSKRYEGLATALYDLFEAEGIPFNIAYVRGGESRFDGLLHNRYDFVISSCFAAEEMIKKNNQLHISNRLGERSFVGGHTILLRDGIERRIIDGMKIGVDPNSFDQRNLTEHAFKDKKVIFEIIPYNQLITKLQNHEIDATVWNSDEVAERYNFLQQMPLQLPDETSTANTEAVMVINNENQAIANLLKEVISVEQIRQIQERVLSNKQAPRY